MKKVRWRWFAVIFSVVAVVWIYWSFNYQEDGFRRMLQSDLERLAFDYPDKITLFATASASMRPPPELSVEKTVDLGSTRYHRILDGPVDVSSEAEVIRKMLFLHNAYHPSVIHLCGFNGEYLIRFYRPDIVMDMWICYGCGELQMFTFTGEKVQTAVNFGFENYLESCDERDDLDLIYIDVGSRLFDFSNRWARFLKE